MDVDEFARRNADPIRLQQNGMWEYMDQTEDLESGEGFPRFVTAYPTSAEDLGVESD